MSKFKYTKEEALAISEEQINALPIEDQKEVGMLLKAARYDDPTF